MKSNEIKRVDFGNWVPTKMIIAPAALGMLCLGLGLLHWLFLIPAALFLVIGGYFFLARRIFSPRSGNLQAQVQELVVKHVDWNGKGRALDIGCGNGPLAIRLAQKYPGAEITGLDYWGRNWDYSIEVCQENARLSGAGERITFQQGSAASLPFEDNSFDLVVSNLVFHEVRDLADKRVSIREAIRVLKPGGVFVLQDLFLLRPYFGAPEELSASLRDWGVREVEFIRTCDEAFIPGLVKLPFMVGTLAILRGIK
jgi:SAM-dependent methyltransferase